MSKLFSLAAVAVGLILSAAPASAQDWVSSIIAEQKRQAGEATARPAKAAPKAVAQRKETAPEKKTAEKAAKPTRTAKAKPADDTDDGSRPQRKTASKAAPKESLSGGETGVASYYWQPQALASGGRFNPDAMTAAHKTLPFGTRVRVTRADNGNSVDVVINDRGPYIAGRIIDLSRRAAQDIGMTGQGVARVRVNILGRG
jgi:rare lipoprotein A (peptidoglycan hydrolase)